MVRARRTGCDSVVSCAIKIGGWKGGVGLAGRDIIWNKEEGFSSGQYKYALGKTG